MELQNVQVERGACRLTIHYSGRSGNRGNLVTWSISYGFVGLLSFSPPKDESWCIGFVKMTFWQRACRPGTSKATENVFNLVSAGEGISDLAVVQSLGN